MFPTQAIRRFRERQSGRSRFEQTVLPHLDAAYNLARWMTRNDQDAEDVVQEATLRALRFADSCHGADVRAWFLAIVRNAGYTWLRQNRTHEPIGVLDDDWQAAQPAEQSDPERLLMQRLDVQAIREALEELPVEFREVIVLREMEGFSYREIADIAAIPVGTVMSRLARARKRLQASLAARAVEEGAPS